MRVATSGLSTLAAVCVLIAPLLAQRPIDLRDRGFRSGAELVTTPVTVRDVNGRLITTLKQSDFTVDEDGAEQPITQFTKERVPVSLALVLDTSDSMRGQRMVDARTALFRFLDDLLAPPDEVALVGFNHAARVIAGWTSERPPLHARLDDLHPSGGTAMYDAIYVTLPLFESRTHPRAAMVLVSDGADTASDISTTRLKQTLVRSDVFLYAIAIDSGDERASTRVNPYTLGELTAQGGGYSEVIRTAADLGPATERIAEELNSQYMIGYTPTTRADGKYHSVRVKVNNPEYKVRARRGVVR
ncbi:MAG: VWA domain-containing protein [Vicinamibacterales bacterium]